MGSFINAEEGSEAKAIHDMEEVYMNYIKNHKNNVIKAFNNLYTKAINEYDRTGSIDGFPSNPYFTISEFYNSIKGLIENEDIINHDNSKYSDSEFPQYRAHWNPTKNEQNASRDTTQAVEASYQKAGEHHYKNNNHHPEFWYDFEKKMAEDMPLFAILHMLADWGSFDPDNLSNIKEWYTNDCTEEKNFMSEKTKAIVDILLDWLCK